jgi:hypothetical protein
MKPILPFWGTGNQLAKTEIINVLLIIFLWIIMSVVVNPLGDFPLNDDWVYGRAVQSIVEKGSFTLAGGNTSANLIAQAYWGALFCLPFGFSFTALRISTLILGLMGVLASYGLLREVGTGRPISLFGTFLIALNPIYFSLSNTFMTDIPFYSLAIMSLYFLIRGLKHNRRIELIFGIFLSYLSLFVRQNGIVILVAFGFAYLVKKGLSKASFARAFTPTLFGICLQFIYQSWLELTNRTSPNFNLQVKGLSKILAGDIGTIISNLTNNTFIALTYIGLFASPLIIPIFIRKFKALPLSEKRLIVFAIPSLCILKIIRLINWHRYMPFGGNFNDSVRFGHILVPFGVGPLYTHDTYILGINYPVTPIILEYIWKALTIIAVFSAALLIYYLLATIRQTFQKPEKTESISPNWLKALVILSILFYFLPLGINGFFDRYLLILIPLLMIVVTISDPIISQSYSINAKTISIASVIMLIYGGFTIGATHDYLSWNRFRWQALNDLLNDRKVLPNYIDGGYEFNGWYLYNPNDTYAQLSNTKPEKPDQSWWYIDRDDYMITFGSLHNYEELKRYPTGRWLPFGPETIFVLRKKVARIVKLE